MRSRRPFGAAFCLLCFSACMVSEQIGEGNEELTFHFDTDFNLYLLFGRSAAIAVLALWIFTSWKKSTVATIIAAVVFGAAVWLVIQDLPSLKSYEVHVLEGGLELNIPPDSQKRIHWNSIETLELEGFEYMAIPMAASTPFSPGSQLELPEWETMEIKTNDGQTHLLNLKRLSLEQRQILAQAIVKRAQLVSE
jgi:hypothetical protein